MQDKQMMIGLGDALKRMLKVELDRRHKRQSPTESIEEVRMITEALNAHQIPLEMSCTIDPGVEGVLVFQKSVQTSCCRINSGSSSRSAHSSALSGSRR